MGKYATENNIGFSVYSFNSIDYYTIGGFLNYGFEDYESENNENSSDEETKEAEKDFYETIIPSDNLMIKGWKYFDEKGQEMKNKKTN